MLGDGKKGKGKGKRKIGNAAKRPVVEVPPYCSLAPI